MSMFSAFEIAGSAMSAQAQRMNVTASNMANADSVAGPDGETYRAKQVMFETQAQSNRYGVGGVRVEDRHWVDGWALGPVPQEGRSGWPGLHAVQTE